MSARFEQSIIDWYSHSRTANLEYLDLAFENSNPQTLDYCKNSAHNIVVVYDRISLLSKACLKNFHLILDEQRSHIATLQSENKFIVKRLQAIESELRAQKPLTKTEISTLVKEISAQPKLVEEQALALTTELTAQVQQVKALLQQIREVL